MAKPTIRFELYRSTRMPDTNDKTTAGIIGAVKRDENCDCVMLKSLINSPASGDS